MLQYLLPEDHHQYLLNSNWVGKHMTCRRRLRRADLPKSAREVGLLEEVVLGDVVVIVLEEYSRILRRGQRLV